MAKKLLPTQRRRTENPPPKTIHRVMKYTVKKIMIETYRDYFEDSDDDYFEDAVATLENIASVFSMIPNLTEPRVQNWLDDLADDLEGFAAALEKQASKIDELETDLRWAETEKEEAETEQSRLEDRLDELKRLPESILNHFDRNPHLMDDLRNLASALRFDNQHANAELIAQTVSVLESIQITAA